MKRKRMQSAASAGRCGRFDILPAERLAMERLGHLPLNFRAMAVVSNLFRASRAVGRRIEASALGPDHLSLTSFVTLWVLWVCGSMEVRELAATVGMSRPTASCVVATLSRRGCVHRRQGVKDGRTVFVLLTPKGRRTVKRLIVAFNAQEVAVTASLTPRQQEVLSKMLRSIVHRGRPFDINSYVVDRSSLL
jgi:DNA-binding MarR family transcriptional regulator